MDERVTIQELTIENEALSIKLRSHEQGHSVELERTKGELAATLSKLSALTIELDNERSGRLHNGEKALEHYNRAIAAEDRLDDALQRLADARHAFDHIEEHGGMDGYARNTLKQALVVETPCRLCGGAPCACPKDRP